MPGMKATMHEFKHGTLHSGSKKSPKVTSRAQAIAIGMSEQRESHAYDWRKQRGKRAPLKLRSNAKS